MKLDVFYVISTWVEYSVTFLFHHWYSPLVQLWSTNIHSFVHHLWSIRLFCDIHSLLITNVWLDQPHNTCRTTEQICGERLTERERQTDRGQRWNNWPWKGPKVLLLLGLGEGFSQAHSSLVNLKRKSRNLKCGGEENLVGPNGQFSKSTKIPKTAASLGRGSLAFYLFLWQAMC